MELKNLSDEDKKSIYIYLSLSERKKGYVDALLKDLAIKEKKISFKIMI